MFVCYQDDVQRERDDLLLVFSSVPQPEPFDVRAPTNPAPRKQSPFSALRRQLDLAA